LRRPLLGKHEVGRALRLLAVCGLLAATVGVEPAVAETVKRKYGSTTSHDPVSISRSELRSGGVRARIEVEDAGAYVPGAIAVVRLRFAHGSTPAPVQLEVQVSGRGAEPFAADGSATRIRRDGTRWTLSFEVRPDQEQTISLSARIDGEPALEPRRAILELTLAERGARSPPGEAAQSTVGLLVMDCAAHFARELEAIGKRLREYVGLSTGLVLPGRWLFGPPSRDQLSAALQDVMPALEQIVAASEKDRSDPLSAYSRSTPMVDLASFVSLKPTAGQCAATPHILAHIRSAIGASRSTAHRTAEIAHEMLAAARAAVERATDRPQKQARNVGDLLRALARRKLFAEAERHLTDQVEPIAHLAWLAHVGLDKAGAELSSAERAHLAQVLAIVEAAAYAEGEARRAISGRDRLAAALHDIEAAHTRSCICDR
jgi:hypothetical protein